ncbi:MAG TPA: ubiquinol-cytochrome c reductase iron-sulfur subunit [Ktedonobacterales bacterium]|nr:ubiquinol-cytochrome c reductase iron-sulfur subunit [Ktedonobacterales bacterium]
MSIETPKKPDEPLLPQQYEVETGGGAEAAEMARRGLSRRQVLRRAVGGVLALFGAEATAGSLAMFYPNLSGQFGSPIDIGAKSQFKASAFHEAQIDSQGIFYVAAAKAYIVHLTADTSFLLNGTVLGNQLDAESWVKDSDGTYWIALYQKCVHLGCKVPFRDDCHSFKCPCHGSHYNVDGEYLDGPAPRSLDRFTLTFQGNDLVVDTGKINNAVERPDTQTRLISTDGTACSV